MWFSMINRNVAFVLLFGVLAGNALAQTGFTETALARAVPFWWPTTVDLPPGAEPTRDQVLVLLKELFPDPYKGDGLPIQDVEAFRFVPLAPGKIHLVVVADFTGRAFFNVVEVIHCERQTCQTIGIQSDAPNDLDKQLVDIDGDGVYELITKQLVEFYRGGDTKPIYTYSIRKLMGRGLVESTAAASMPNTSRVICFPRSRRRCGSGSNSRTRHSAPRAVPRPSSPTTITAGGYSERRQPALNTRWRGWRRTTIRSGSWR